MAGTEQGTKYIWVLWGEVRQGPGCWWGEGCCVVRHSGGKLGIGRELGIGGGGGDVGGELGVGGELVGVWWGVGYWWGSWWGMLGGDWGMFGGKCWN